MERSNEKRKKIKSVCRSFEFAVVKSRAAAFHWIRNHSRVFFFASPLGSSACVVSLTETVVVVQTQSFYTCFLSMHWLTCSVSANACLFSAHCRQNSHVFIKIFGRRQPYSYWQVTQPHCASLLFIFVVSPLVMASLRAGSWHSSRNRRFFFFDKLL